MSEWEGLEVVMSNRRTTKCACGRHDLDRFIQGDFETTASLVTTLGKHSVRECEFVGYFEASALDLPLRFDYTSTRIRPPLPPPLPTLVPVWRSRTEEWKNIEHARIRYSEDRQQWPGEEWLRHVTQILTSSSGEGAITDNALCRALALIELRIGRDFKAEKHDYFIDHREFTLQLILNNLTHSGTAYDTWIKAAERIVGELMRRAK